MGLLDAAAAIPAKNEGTVSVAQLASVMKEVDAWLINRSTLFLGSH